MLENNSQKLIDVISRQDIPAIGVTSSPSSTLKIIIDIKDDSSSGRTLGQMVYVLLKEDGQNILVIGQIVEVETQNRWHEDPSFKGVIKRHGRLPHLSGTADNRVATLSVQACYSLALQNPEGYILGTSPSTGEQVQKMNNEVMDGLMANHKKHVTYMGKVYGTDVDLPFWFKHFDVTDAESEEMGAGDAYHIGVFGKTGSGKSVTAACMLLGYARNKKNMSILVLDPQQQFISDQGLLPDGTTLESVAKEIGSNYQKLKILSDVCLPGNNFELFGELLQNTNFVKDAFGPFYTEEKCELAKEAVVSYISGYEQQPGFSLNRISDPKDLLKKMLTSFTKTTTTGTKIKYSKYVEMVYSPDNRRQDLHARMKVVLDNLDTETNLLQKWQNTLNLFSKLKVDGTDKLTIKGLVKKVIEEKGNFIVLDISGRDGVRENENLKALFIKLIQKGIVDKGIELYEQKKKANCLIVMDEAHRFISIDSTDPRIKELTKEIIDSVRTTRKYGIGYMFITQTIDSLDREILRQMRIFAFGYGLTSGPELRKISEQVNNDSAVRLYQSFIDPSSNGKFPFMFFGPISPLSFTGSPLFLEVYTSFGQLKKGLGMVATEQKES